MWVAGCVVLAWLAAHSLQASGSLVLVVGAPGEEEYQTAFAEQAAAWQTAGKHAGWETAIIGLQPGPGTNDLRELRERVSASATNTGPLWLVFIGHGSFDGKTAKFNLRGPDVQASDLAEWLGGVRSTVVLINTAASSAPFLNQLSATNRLIVTATRSGHEQNYTRFGKYMAAAIRGPEADLDKDEQVSLLEAFLFASRRTAEFYKTEGRIATEHALIDDNGDGMGTPSDWFQGLRPSKKPQDNKAAVDGRFARQQHLVPSEADSRLTPAQRLRRDELERAVFDLRERKPQMAEPDYYAALERLLLQLAEIYQ